MSYLQLADNGNQLLPHEILEYMLQIPDESGQMVWVREDQLDHLPDEVLYQILQQQPHLSGIRDMFQRMRGRRQDRKQERFEGRQARQETRATRKGGTFMERLTGGIGQVVGQFKGGDQQLPGGTRGAEDWFPQITGGASFGVAKWWQNPLVIGGMALAFIGGIWILTKKKK